MTTPEADEPATARMSQARSSRFLVQASAVMVLVALLFLPRLGDRALWSSEGRWAEIAREMQLSSNYFWPTINGKLYYDKPLLSYWLVVGAAHLTGTVNEAASRLPCALSGLLGVALAMLLARRFYDRRTALLAGFILATSYSFVFFSRHANADIETVTGELAALLLLLRFREHPKGWSVLGAWVAMAVTSLTKGLLGFALPILVMGVYSSLADDWRELAARLAKPTKLVGRLIEQNRWLFNWKTIPAVAVAGAIYYVPFAISHAQAHSEAGIQMVLRENVVRFFRPFDHRGPVYLYFGAIFALMAPWSVFLPAALVNAHASHGETADTGQSNRFALAYFWATFVFFTLSGSRRSYYLLPILPAAAFLVARLFTVAHFDLPAIARRLMNLGYFLLIGAVALGVVILTPVSIRPGVLSQYPPAPAPIIFTLMWLMMIGTALYALRELRQVRMALSSGVIAYFTLVFLFIFAMPEVERYRGEQPFAQAVRAKLQGDLSTLAMFRIWGPGLVFYLSPDKPIPEFKDPADLTNFVRDNQVRWLIVRERDLSSLPLTGSAVVRETIFPWEKSSRTRNKYLLLDLKPGPIARN